MQKIQCQRLKVPFLTLPRSLKIAFLNGPKPFPKIAWLAPYVCFLTHNYRLFFHMKNIWFLVFGNFSYSGKAESINHQDVIST